MSAEALPHDPDALLDYGWDWSEWLGSDTITGHTVTVVSGGVTIANQAHDATSVTAWITGGTQGSFAGVTCHITTAGGRADDRTLTLAVRQR